MRKKGTYRQYVARHKADVKAGRSSGKQLSQGAWNAYHNDKHHGSNHHRGKTSDHEDHAKALKSKAWSHSESERKAERRAESAGNKTLKDAYKTLKYTCWILLVLQ